MLWLKLEHQRAKCLKWATYQGRRSCGRTSAGLEEGGPGGAGYKTPEPETSTPEELLMDTMERRRGDWEEEQTIHRIHILFSSLY